MKKHFLSLSMVAALIVSCTKSSDETPDTPVTPQVEVSQGGVVKPAVGGGNQPNTVYVNLATNTTTSVKRDAWDFGFYCGNDFRVIINNNIKMAVKELETSDMSVVQAEDTSVAVGFSTLAIKGYVDSPDGVLNSTEKGRGTAIAAVSANASENKVYLVNMGNVVATDVPKAGSVNLHGASRGWKKVKILRSGNDYEIQYADLTDTTFKTIKVSKNPEYNFVYINLSEAKFVDVEPKKNDWDLAFTGFTTYTSMGKDDAFDKAITYYFSDLVLNNIHAGVKVYKVESTSENRDKDYDAYSKTNAQSIDFKLLKDTQLLVGSSWRDVFKKTPIDNVFYVLKDSKGNFFKIRFLALVNEKGERGNPVFEYKLLQ